MRVVHIFGHVAVLLPTMDISVKINMSIFCVWLIKHVLKVEIPACVPYIYACCSYITDHVTITTYTGR